MLIQVSWEKPYRAACAALAVSDGWGSSGVTDLPCHPGAPGLTYRVTAADTRLHLCLTCLQGYVETAGVVIGPDVEPRNRPPLRVCHRCNREFPLSDFVARSGTLTVFCSPCRTAWGKEKRAQEEAELQAAIAGAANSLRRIQRDMSE